MGESSLPAAAAASRLSRDPRPHGRGKAIYTEVQNQVQTAIVLAATYIAVNLVLTGSATWVQRTYVCERNPLELTRVGPDTDGGQNSGGGMGGTGIV